jgi:glycosyltransferase involved in cell wall biosynthesis
VFIEQRVIIPLADHLRLQRALLAQGYLIVGEIDDDPDHFAELANTGYFALKSCHCLQTTTEVMAQTLRKFNPYVVVFPNQAATLAPPRALASAPGVIEQPTIFFGALNREPDWAPIMPDLNRVLSARGRHVHVQVVYDRAFYDALATAQKAFEPLCSYDRYHEVLHAANIALLPLEPTRFNRHKSDLKFIECAMHGTAVLASATVYGNTIIHGETGLVYNSADEFGPLLTQLIDDVPLRCRLGQNARQYVAENRLLARHFHARYEWYRQMFGRRHELNAELHLRVPELFTS